MLLRPKKFFLFRFKRKVAFLIFCAALLFSWTHFDVSSFFLKALVPISEMPYFFDHKKVLMNEIESLKRKNAQLLAEISRFQALESEWAQVAPLLAFDVVTHPGTITKVLSVNHDTKTALLAIGTKHGIKPGMFVLNEQGIVGKIETVSRDVSRMIFLTHPHFKASVCGQDSREQCIVSGNDQDYLLLVYRQTVNPLKHKEHLLISQYNQMCPAGYVVGYWDQDKGGVVPMASMHQLDYVRVLFPDALDSEVFIEP